MTPAHCEVKGCYRHAHLAWYTYPYPAPGQRATHLLCPEHKAMREYHAERSKWLREQVPGGQP
jgi:hypothetical protein